MRPIEKKLLELIIANPFADQNELAEALGLARSTVAAQIVQLMNKGHIVGRGYILPQSEKILCIGGGCFVRKHYITGEPQLGAANPSTVYRNFGGVARNVAENLARLGARVEFISAVGDDENGASLLRQLRDVGIDTSQTMIVPGYSTAEYVALLSPSRALVIGAMDMDVFDQMTDSVLDRVWPHISSASWVLADCNLPVATLESLILRRGSARFKLAIETVTPAKARRLPMDLCGVDLIFTNRDEAKSLLGMAPETSVSPNRFVAELRARGLRAGIINLDIDGLVCFDENTAVLLSPVPADIVDLSGGRDALTAGTILRLSKGISLSEASTTGTLAAALTVECSMEVHPGMSMAIINAARARLLGQSIEPLAP